jgi:hypothetical protein
MFKAVRFADVTIKFTYIYANNLMYMNPETSSSFYHYSYFV